MAESTDDDSIMVSKSQEYNIKHYSDSMINASNQVSSDPSDPSGNGGRLPPRTVIQSNICIRIVDVYTVISSQLF